MGLSVTSTRLYVTATPAQVIPPNANRTKLNLENIGAVWIDYNFFLKDEAAGVVFRLGPSEGIELTAEEDGDLVHMAIFASVQFGNCMLSIMETVPDMS